MPYDILNPPPEPVIRENLRALLEATSGMGTVVGWEKSAIGPEQGAQLVRQADGTHWGVVVSYVKLDEDDDPDKSVGNRIIRRIKYSLEFYLTYDENRGDGVLSKNYFTYTMIDGAANTIRRARSLGFGNRALVENQLLHTQQDWRPEESERDGTLHYAKCWLIVNVYMSIADVCN